jgi:hypothetical protein
MATPRPRGPTNLTEAAELASWSGTLRWAVPDPAAADDGGGPALEVRALDDAEAAAEGDRSPGPCGEVYVVASGQGALRCGGEVAEFTAGDVLLAPAGVAHRLERLGGPFRLWRVSLGRRPPGAGSSGRSPRAPSAAPGR